MYNIKHAVKFLVFLSIFSSHALQANTVSAGSVGQTIAPGDIFSLTISGTDFTTALDAGGLDISFDDTVIQAAPLNELPSGVAEQVNLDPLWDVQSPRAPVLNANSIDDIFFFTSGFDAIGDFDIVTIWFKAISAGTSPVQLVESQLNPFAGAGAALSVDLIDGEVQVVPVPPALWLMASGIFGFISMRRLSRQS